MKKILPLLLLLLCSSTLFAQTIYYVKPTGNDANGGTSWATAFRTVQRALSVIISGQIWVAAGTYYPDEIGTTNSNDRNATFFMKNNVAIYGGFTGTETDLKARDWKFNSTILSGESDGIPGNDGNAHHVVYAAAVNKTAVLDGFTITGGNSGINGGGIYLDIASPTIANCTFAGNYATNYGGGMFNKNSEPTIINCIFSANSSEQGGGIYNYFSSPTITNCRITGNSSDSYGGGIYNTGSSPTITNCIFSENHTGEGGGIFNTGSSPTITHCRFTGNSSGIYGGGIYNSGSSPTITNCIFSENHAADGGGIFNTGSSSYTITNSTFTANSANHRGGAIYITASNPTLINCSFAGNTASETGGGVYNTGSSYLRILNCILWGNSNAFTNAQGGSAEVFWSIVQGGFTGTNNLNVDPLFVNAAGGDLHLHPCSPAIDAGTAMGAPATDLDGHPRPQLGGYDIGAYEFQGTVSSKPFVLYVDSSATGNGDGSSWTNACTKLQDALSKAGKCSGQIWVAAGTYYPDEGTGFTGNDRTLSFDLKAGVALYGGFAGGETVLSERNWKNNLTTLSGEIQQDNNSHNNSYHVVKSVSLTSTALLDGFTITGGAAPVYPGGDYFTPEYEGGGMYNYYSSPKIANCRFWENASVKGGGMYNESSSPTITNCSFWKNSAVAGGYGGGGGIANSNSSPVITNCSFSLNNADGGGGIDNISSSPIITNCILWGNAPDQIQNLINSTPTVTYSNVQGGTSENQNKNQDPLFEDASTGNLHLMPGSPSINTGDNSVVHTGDLDLDANARIVNEVVDMGAYEFVPGPVGTPPLTLTCPPDFTLQSDAGSCGAVVDFTGPRAATSSGGKALVTISYAPSSGTLLPVGENTITVTATDGEGTTKTCSFTVTVVDATPPVLTGVTAMPSVLYPPNHKLQDVTVNYDASDCSEVTTTLSVSSNEPVYTAGSGDTGPDWEVINDHKVKLRAERSGSGNGRVYTITITATDAAGNTATATTTVTVPHDKGAPVTRSEAAIGKEVAGLQVSALPNPSTAGFTLQVQSPSVLPLDMTVLDASGRVVESRSGVAPNGVLYIGTTYRPGVYHVQVQQGDVRQTLRLIKQAH